MMTSCDNSNFTSIPDSNSFQSLQLEIERHNDIIVANISDQYTLLTNKSMAALRWAASRCPSARFVAKTDDDSFNVVARLVDYLKDAHDESSVGGKINN